MSSDSHNRIEVFFNDYKRIKFNLLEKKISTMNLYFKEYTKLYNEKKKKDILYTPNYSIFSSLKFTRPEEQLHSPFIFHLLNPEGDHKQQDEFYKLFINSILRNEISENFINSDFKDYYFKLEQKTSSKIGDGRIDIFIKSKNKNKPFAIIFELKWNSPDSSADQIYKYYLSIKESKEFHDDNILMIYLTKHGQNPKLVRRNKYKNLINNYNNRNFINISYEKDILNWLNLCESNVQSEKVKSTIVQYRNFLNSNL